MLDIRVLRISVYKCIESILVEIFYVHPYFLGINFQNRITGCHCPNISCVMYCLLVQSCCCSHLYSLMNHRSILSNYSKNTIGIIKRKWLMYINMVRSNPLWCSRSKIKHISKIMYFLVIWQKDPRVPLGMKSIGFFFPLDIRTHITQLKLWYWHWKSIAVCVCIYIYTFVCTVECFLSPK